MDDFILWLSMAFMVAGYFCFSYANQQNHPVYKAANAVVAVVLAIVMVPLFVLSLPVRILGWLTEKK